MADEACRRDLAGVLDEALLKLSDLDREVVARRYLYGETNGDHFC